MPTKLSSFLWILLAYILCSSAGFSYLVYAKAHVLFDGNVLLNSFIADTIATLVIFVFSRIFKNTSFYDAYWSVIPPLFLLYWWFSKDVETPDLRFILVSIVVWFWAIRLTWNWAKHWDGLAHEDWRYPIVKQQFPKLEFFSDFFALHYFPTVEVFLGMLPIYASVALSTKEVGLLDFIACGLGVSAASIQLIADRQLHAFIALRKPGQIIDTGMWAWSRHPNYFGELLFWFSLALFGIASYPEGWKWQGLGFLSMLCMFTFASIPLMEKRSLERRPQYQEIINRISMIIPLPPKKK